MGIRGLSSHILILVMGGMLAIVASACSPKFNHQAAPNTASPVNGIAIPGNSIFDTSSQTGGSAASANFKLPGASSNTTVQSKTQSVSANFKVTGGINAIY